METKRVLCGVPGYERLCPMGLKLLEDNGFTVELSPYGRQYAFDELKDVIGEYDAVISGLELWDGRLFSLAKKLKIIAKFGVGLDSIDLDAAKAAGVCITYAKGLNAVSVANTAVMLMLASLKKLTQFDAATKRGEWPRMSTNDLDGKTVGFIGFGEISRYVIERLQGFNVRFMAYDAFPDSDAARRLGVTLADMDTVLGSADVISVHVPLLESTRHLMNAEAFSKMKPTAVFINTSRGKVVDESALYDALSEGRIAAAAIDVFEEEPTNPHNPLFGLEGFTCTPHTAADTQESAARVGYMAAKNIVSFFSGEPLELVVLK